MGLDATRQIGRILVDPNPDVVWVSNTALYRSTDAGQTWTPIKGAPGGDDYHQLWIAPEDPNRMIVGSDQGAIVTVDGAATFVYKATDGGTSWAQISPDLTREDPGVPPNLDAPAAADAPAGGGGGRGGAPPVQPGTYIVRLTVGGRTLTQPLAVMADPRR